MSMIKLNKSQSDILNNIFNEENISKNTKNKIINFLESLELDIEQLLQIIKNVDLEFLNTLINRLVSEFKLDLNANVTTVVPANAGVTAPTAENKENVNKDSFTLYIKKSSIRMTKDVVNVFRQFDKNIQLVKLMNNLRNPEGGAWKFKTEITKKDADKITEELKKINLETEIREE